MNYQFHTILKSAALAAGCALLGACGGGNSGTTEQGPAALFPNGVKNGSLTIGQGNELMLTISYLGTDPTQGGAYSGIINIPRSATTAEVTQQSFSGSNLRQSPASQPGLVVLLFDGPTTQQPLVGTLVLQLPADQAYDTQQYRGGTVAADTDLSYYDERGTRYRTNLTDLPVSIHWDKAEE